MLAESNTTRVKYTIPIDDISMLTHYFGARSAQIPGYMYCKIHSPIPKYLIRPKGQELNIFKTGIIE